MTNNVRCGVAYKVKREREREREREVEGNMS